MAYTYIQRLPGAATVATPQLVAPGASVFEGIAKVWWIFLWGAGLQLIIQLFRIVRRRPKEANLRQLLGHGAWISLNAGVFEEIIFRYYAYVSSVILLVYANILSGGLLEQIAGLLMPVANVLTLGLLSSEFNPTNWSVGLAIIIGSIFFRDAHRHYGKLAKANVWFIGMVMFWLVFNYGLITAIIAHVLYDFAIYGVIALTSPLQPQPVERSSLAEPKD